MEAEGAAATGATARLICGADNDEAGTTGSADGTDTRTPGPQDSKKGGVGSQNGYYLPAMLPPPPRNVVPKEE